VRVLIRRLWLLVMHVEIRFSTRSWTSLFAGVRLDAIAFRSLLTLRLRDRVVADARISHPTPSCDGLVQFGMGISCQGYSNQPTAVLFGTDQESSIVGVSDLRS
jgi:hypothetical protein